MENLFYINVDMPYSAVEGKGKVDKCPPREKMADRVNSLVIEPDFDQPFKLNQVEHTGIKWGKAYHIGAIAALISKPVRAIGKVMGREIGLIKRTAKVEREQSVIHPYSQAENVAPHDILDVSDSKQKSQKILENLQIAYDKCINNWLGFINSENHVKFNNKFEKNKKVALTYKELESFKKGLKKDLKEKYGISGKDFDKQYKLAGVNNSPQSMVNSITIHGQELQEQTSLIDMDCASQYLRQRRKGDEAAVIESGGRFRPSILKKEGEFQCMITNGHKHVIKENGVVVASVLRSGAFAVHGRKEERIKQLQGEKERILNLFPAHALEINEQIKLVSSSKEMGLYQLEKHLKAYDDELKKNELMDSKKLARLDNQFKECGCLNLEEFRMELSARRDLALAQALPKIVKSVEDMAKNPEALAMAVATGSFLHVEECFLSHADSDEKHMIEDMKGAMDYLREHAKIKFSNVKTPTIQIDESDPNHEKIMILLPQTDAENISEEHEFGLEALHFTTGVNEWQSINSSFKYDPLQAEINTEGLNRLSDHAKKAYEALSDKAGSQVNLSEARRTALREGLEVSWISLRTHYGENESRSEKDIRGVDLRGNVIRMVGGGLGIVCKSGKDRTGVEVSRELAKDVAARLNLDEEELKGKLFAGISHRITGLNTLDEDGYAFSIAQQPYLPSEITPPSSLCKWVAT